ncbi:putative ABC transport system permease protein [Catalinimonas alkaloidigena]|uniref:Putative ABC transport system permease protein n=1 Tax=Catalinimonas alkaloidigena TaxID=1075417 RepID=A0A1G8YI21_9BACT|nr:permease prefix domain 2-containing transporter [Catalinimonas alkaloidigena]SDK02084.1 putative ABC transport system permease protein [Catalinimonas alkaloidigena]
MKQPDFLPPRGADRLLERFCAPDLREEVLGDLHELYGTWEVRYGRRKARQRYWWHVLKFLRPSALKRRRPIPNQSSTSLPLMFDMIRNYLLVAFRHLQRRKGFTLLNVLGLALGLAAFLLILEYVAFEWSANRFHANRDRLYRVLLASPTNEPDFHIPPGVGPGLQENLSGIASSVRVAEGISGGVVTYTAPRSDAPPARTEAALKSFREERAAYVDGNFLEVFSFPLVAGQASLAAPNALALSASEATKYFGETNPIGQILTVHNQFGNTDYTVTGVFEDMPATSDLQLDMLFSLQTLYNPANRNGNDWAEPNNWDNGFLHTYLLLQPEANPATLEKEFVSFRERIRPQDEIRMVLQPFTQIHLAPSFDYALPTFGNLALVVFLLGVALLILLIAWVNYINLSTAQALRRAREVGIRKAIGAQRGQLVGQYLLETLLLTSGAAVLAFGAVQAGQGAFNAFTGQPLSLRVLNQGWFWAGTLLMIGSSTLMAGGYVAGVPVRFSRCGSCAVRSKVRWAVCCCAKGWSCFSSWFPAA